MGQSHHTLFFCPGFFLPRLLFAQFWKWAKRSLPQIFLPRLLFAQASFRPVLKVGKKKPAADLFAQASFCPFPALDRVISRSLFSTGFSLISTFGWMRDRLSTRKVGPYLTSARVLLLLGLCRGISRTDLSLDKSLVLFSKSWITKK